MRLRHTQFDKAKQKNNENKYHKLNEWTVVLRPIPLAFNWMKLSNCLILNCFQGQN